MDYPEQNFKDGQVLKAEHLNHMEEAIDYLADVLSGKVPHVVDSVIIKDRSTSKTYTVYVSDGKLTMEERSM